MVSLLNRVGHRLAAPLTTPASPSSVARSLIGDPRRATITSITTPFPGAAHLRLRTGRSWRGHQAGQFVTVGVDIDGVRHQRCYSITSVPEPSRRGHAEIEITVVAVPGGTVSTHLVERARCGDTLLLDDAAGTFTLSDPLTGPGLLLLTGGSGLTPAMAMIRHLATLDDAPSVVLLHHCPGPDRQLFAAELERLERAEPWLRTSVVFTRVADRDGTVAGKHLDAAELDRRCPDWRDRDAYVCGPSGLVDFAVTHWTDAGLHGRLRTESFTPFATGAAVAPAAPGLDQGDVAQVAIRLQRSDRDLSADASLTLLDAAEAAGVTPPSGCRSGICHTCTTRLCAGEVDDLRTGQRLGAGSHVQLCVTRANGPVTLDL